MDIVLIEPKTSGNVGAIARVMKNFGFKNLILINPKCEINKEALNRASHARDILEKVKITDMNCLKKYDCKIGTTAKIGNDYNILRIPLLPKEMAEKIKKTKNKTALILGREETGLKNSELKQCDFVVTIPTDKKYKTMNISHSLAILLYEINETKDENRITKTFKTATKKEKDRIMELLDNAMDKMDFPTESKKETQRKLWKKLIGKSNLTRRESFALMGFLKRIEKLK
ncbi:TrmJ/YjtD family RNA methyltransferase [Candidatus Woesearchaeota archaeon]|nr:TrmJ/YjtD family RNA methyltransferase [Candidatus Woesearchaeota archaeon]